MEARAIIAKLRDGLTLGPEDLNWFANGLANGEVSDAQAGAFAMAAVLNGLGDQGRRDLTLAMRDSGDVLGWSLDRPVLDKHSTGGIGDCVSLVLAPCLAACGAYVPMISGRGLGHTGGTLDKLEAIRGFRTGLSETELKTAVREVGCAIVSASQRIAPADKRLYAVRDVTATVESLDLITASILSKKLAAGLEGLVLDVKVGSGAFMQRPDQARDLAMALVSTANAAGCPTTALITDMNQPLADQMGNALEVAASIQVLTGQDAGRLLDLTAILGGELLFNAGLARDPADGDCQVRSSIQSGKAAEVFGRMVAQQGGPSSFLDTWMNDLPKAAVIKEIPAPASGYVRAWDGRALGVCVVDLGGGRHVETDRIDPSVGLSALVPLGTRVQTGEGLGRVHAADDAAAQKAIATVQSAVTLSAERLTPPSLVHERIA